MLITASLSSLLLVSCGGEAEKTAEATTETVAEMPKEDTTAIAAPAPKDVVDIAIGSADHSTLVPAVTAASLVETLKGAGPFTIFAPTNAAFAALPAGTVDGLLKPESKAKLPVF